MWKKYFGPRELLLTAAGVTAALGLTAIFVELFGINHGYLTLLASILLLTVLLWTDRITNLRRYIEDKSALQKELELKDILYQLLQKTSGYDGNEDIYGEILKAAIHSLPNGEKGSIIDIRVPDKVRYVAVEGFERRVLEKMGLSLKDTYLYKETHGAMDKTVIIKNSVNYNQLHSNDGLVMELIAAGTAGIQSTICTPIILKDKAIGMINIDSGVRDAFSHRDVQIIELFAMEVSKMIQYYEVIKQNIYLSHYDAMTHICNRSHFYDLHKELYKQSPHVPYVFVSSDIDNLKGVNDAFGHVSGDKLIIHFVKGLKLFIDEDVVFGRYGGDEFNFLFPERTAAAVEAVMEEAKEWFQRNPIDCDGTDVYVAFSYGIVHFPSEEQGYEQLIIEADKRMYAQKYKTKLGGNG